MNGKSFRRVIIDSHYEDRHAESVSDALIMDLIKELKGLFFPMTKELATGYRVFVTEPVWAKAKPFRLVWTYHPDEDYLGVINCFRVKEKRHGKK
jgi:hypothetical protein